MVVRDFQLEILIPCLRVKIQPGTFLTAENISGRIQDRRQLVLGYGKIVFFDFPVPIFYISVFYEKMYKVLYVYATGPNIAYRTPNAFETTQYLDKRNAFYLQAAFFENVLINP